MFNEAQLSSVLDHPVLDSEGKKIGKADHVFYDDATGRPEWVSIKTGLFGTSESFVPITGAHLVEDHLEVPWTKDKVKDAPNVDVDSGGHLSESEEHRLYEHYGIAWEESWRQANESGEGGWAQAHPDNQAGEAAVAGGAGGEAAWAASDRQVAAAEPERVAGRDAMTRSEERMSVGVERQEAGRARLRKYVVTEEQQQTVPLRHEEVRIEREPITEANRDAAMTGQPITEAEHEVVLHAEHAVVDVEAVPVERVRLTTEEVVEEQTVTGEVRKEKVELDLPDTDDPGR
ncbi:PRC and DUF2382 domain-containing protein [Kitasatospora sp. NPDC096147]|uniref:PRC and DUF2382 domain-containing protein n=1 Tax=Kitasatospora sp. NPDC096147 TaxID=3364093 RepID=UPI0038245A93